MSIACTKREGKRNVRRSASSTKGELHATVTGDRSAQDLRYTQESTWYMFSYFTKDYFGPVYYGPVPRSKNRLSGAGESAYAPSRVRLASRVDMHLLWGSRCLPPAQVCRHRVSQFVHGNNVRCSCWGGFVSCAAALDSCVPGEVLSISLSLSLSAPWCMLCIAGEINKKQNSGRQYNDRFIFILMHKLSLYFRSEW